MLQLRSLFSWENASIISCILKSNYSCNFWVLHKNQVTRKDTKVSLFTSLLKIAQTSRTKNHQNFVFSLCLFCNIGTWLSPECSATGMGQFPICKLKWDLLRTSVTACTIDENTFSAPFGIFCMRTEIWKEIFQKKSYTNP